MASGRPSVTVLGATRYRCVAYAQGGRCHGQAGNDREVRCSGAEVSTLGQWDAQQGGRAQRPDELRGHRADRRPRRHVRQELVERQPDRQLDQDRKAAES